MKRISIRPTWTLIDPAAPAFPPRLLELLVHVQAQGSLLAACQHLGVSYRHAWDLVRQGEAHFGTALLNMERGKGSTLTALGEKLVWADHRIAARLTPILESLASELANEIAQVMSSEPPSLRIHASHGFAIEKLIQALRDAGLAIDHKYGASTSAAAALHDGACDIAGLHVPVGALQASGLTQHARWLSGGDALAVIDLAVRRQGFIVPAGNPKKLYELQDLLRPGVRFINRQASSGTRFLLEGLLQQAGIEPERISGFEQGEFTHAAVAAYVASGMADVGFGLEAPARQFHLDFISLASERYFLVCRTAALESDTMQKILTVLRTPQFAASINDLPGYHATNTGRVSDFAAAFDQIAH